MKRSLTLAAALMAIAWGTSPLTADEWQTVAHDEALTLLQVAESALEGHWERSQRGWCRSLLEYRGDEQQFALWWDEDRTGLEVEQVTLGDDRDPRVPTPQLRLALFLPREQWIYFPSIDRCRGFGGRRAQRLQSELDVHPHRIWLAMLDGQSPRLRHLHRLREARKGPQPVVVSRDGAGLLRFDTRSLRLVFDEPRGFSPIRAEYQTKLDELPHPEVMLPVVEEYEPAQDRHGEWYCRQMVRTVWPRGGQGDPTVSKSAVILEYDSNPAASVMRLSFDALGLPDGTTVMSSAPSKAGRWVVGREAEGEQALTEERFRELGRALKARGFAEDEIP